MIGQEFLDGLKDIVYKSEIKPDYLDGDIVDDVRDLIADYEAEEEIGI